MKKCLALFLVVVILLSSSALANNIDFSSMSVNELHDIISQAHNELVKKTAKADGKVFIIDDPMGFSIYLTGKGEKNWMDYYALEVVAINNTNKTQSIIFDNISINGWEVSTFITSISDVGGGKKKKDSINLEIEAADISSYTEITEVELVFHTYDSDSWSTIKKYGPVTLFFDGNNWSTK